MGLLQDLYTAHKDNQTFLHARLGRGEDVLKPYKQTIDRFALTSIQVACDFDLRLIMCLFDSIDGAYYFRSGTVATKLTLEQMKEFVRRHFEDFLNQRKAAVIQKNMTPDFYDHDGPGGKPTGVAGDEQMMIAMYKSMPDMHLTIEDMIAEGDKVMCRNIWWWTDAASGKRMEFHGFVLWRFEGAKIAERWATVTPPAEGVSWTKK